jgi:hypothetical protein
MMLSACHGHPIVAGETARKMAPTLSDDLEIRDLAAQQRQLTAARVKYLVLHRPEGEIFHWAKADGDRAAYEKRYRHVNRDGSLTILQVY